MVGHGLYKHQKKTLICSDPANLVFWAAPFFAYRVFTQNPNLAPEGRRDFCDIAK